MSAELDGVKPVLSRMLIHVGMISAQGLSLKHSVMMQSLLEATSFGEHGYGLTKYDPEKLESLVPLWQGISYQEMDQLYFDLLNDELLYGYECIDGHHWYMAGSGYFGWDRSRAADVSAFEYRLNAHYQEIGLIDVEKQRPSGRKWELTRLSVFERDCFTCVYCNASGVALAVDHILPFSRGGSEDMCNLATACVSCNSSKGDKTPEEWRAAS